MMGLDESVINEFEFSLTLKRICTDVSSDFVFAPHFSVIFRMVGDELWERVAKKLRNGQYEPGLPITIEVPKASGLTRPGSILNPFDRMTYQLLIDHLARSAEKHLDRGRVFSYQLLQPDEKGLMFELNHESYSKLQRRLKILCNKDSLSHVIVADVASYYERLYQHNLTNILESAGCNRRVVGMLQNMLFAFMEKDSHGIIQGVFPSDFLGNFYLCNLDMEHAIRRIPYARYVDDLYIFFRSERAARAHKIVLCSYLRREGLNLNEAKTDTLTTDQLVKEETEIDRMFLEAWDEISSEFEGVDFYHSTVPWDFDYEAKEPLDEEEAELIATQALFNVQNVSERQRDKIDKLCLAVFETATLDLAVDYVLEQMVGRPHMTQIFCKYLSGFVAKDKQIRKKIERLLANKDLLFDSQLMWIYAALMGGGSVSASTVNRTITHLRDFNRNEAFRGVCAVFIGQYGNATQRRMLKYHYRNEPSAYVRSAVLYSARYFPPNERNTCYTSWGKHSEINSLVVKAAKAVGS